MNPIWVAIILLGIGHIGHCLNWEMMRRRIKCLEKRLMELTEDRCCEYRMPLSRCACVKKEP